MCMKVCMCVCEGVHVRVYEGVHVCVYEGVHVCVYEGVRVRERVVCMFVSCKMCVCAIKMKLPGVNSLTKMLHRVILHKTRYVSNNEEKHPLVHMSFTCKASYSTNELL